MIKYFDHDEKDFDDDHEKRKCCRPWKCFYKSLSWKKKIEDDHENVFINVGHEKWKSVTITKNDKMLKHEKWKVDENPKRVLQKFVIKR